MDTPNKSYAYVGSKHILEETNLELGGHKISTVADIRAWIKDRLADMYHGLITATFIINEAEALVISGRHTEHVMCAQGRNVLSAGEIIFHMEGKEIYISEISNQSTGYCPEPSSWPVVELVLARLGIDNPGYFTHAYDFRYCYACGNINLIKDEAYQCLVCGADLDRDWNFDQKTA